MEKICNVIIIINEPEIKFFKKQLSKKVEYAGKIILKPTKNKEIFNIKINKKSVKKGDSDEIDAIISRYNFHVHPEAAYKVNKTQLGWPSEDDYKSFITGFLEFNNLFHILITSEGIYLITVNKKVILPLEKIYKKMGDKLIDKILYPFIKNRINIDKRYFNIEEGRVIKDHDNKFSIHSPLDYVDFINNVCCIADFPLFNLKFQPWSKKIVFNFDFKDGGNCKLKKK